MSKCPRCEARGDQTWTGDPPKCGIGVGDLFRADNWNCATLNALREVATTAFVPVYADDQYAVVMPLTDGCFLVVGWYKNRGSTEYVGVLAEHVVGVATLADIETAMVMACAG